MKIDIVSVLPQMFNGLLDESILKRGTEKGLIRINIHNLRDWCFDKHQVVDAPPYGGGPGMIMKVEPLWRAVESLREPDSLVILTSPRGEVLKQKRVHELCLLNHLIILCGHYKGVDQRVYELIDLELSLGDFILTGGEIAAAAIADAVCRLVPGVISDIDSANTDSFENTLLDCGYYTKPAEFNGLKVPDVLQNGNHKLIKEWRLKDALETTKIKRPELYLEYQKNNLK